MEQVEQVYGTCGTGILYKNVQGEKQQKQIISHVVKLSISKYSY